MKEYRLNHEQLKEMPGGAGVWQGTSFGLTNEECSYIHGNITGKNKHTNMSGYKWVMRKSYEVL